MGSFPVNSLALRALEKKVVVVVNEIWDLAFRFAPRDFRERGITEKASGKEFFFAESNHSSLNELSELPRGMIILHSENPILWPFRNEFCVPG